MRVDSEDRKALARPLQVTSVGFARGRWGFQLEGAAGTEAQSCE